MPRRCEGQRACRHKHSCRPFEVLNLDPLSDNGLGFSLPSPWYITEIRRQIEQTSEQSHSKARTRSNWWYEYTQDTFRRMTLSFSANFCLAAVIGKGNSTAPGGRISIAILISLFDPLPFYWKMFSADALPPRHCFRIFKESTTQVPYPLNFKVGVQDDSHLSAGLRPAPWVLQRAKSFQSHLYNTYFSTSLSPAI